MQRNQTPKKSKKLHRSPDYRPDSRRALFITGTIDESNAERLTRETVALLDSSEEPITVYIDSPGGSTFFAECIFRTIKLPSPDTTDSHRIITVGLNVAASAACDLLVAGDYAVVYPHTVLLCHGVRQSGEGLNVTRETALSLAKSLASSNEQFALQLANNAISRFIFRFVTLRHLFESIREKEALTTLSDTSCFLKALEPHMSGSLMNILTQGMLNHLDNDLIDFAISEKIANAEHPSSDDRVAFEAFLLKCIIEYEAENNKNTPNWSFRTNGLPQLESKFAVLLNSHDDHHKQQIERLVVRWGEFLLSEEDRREYATIANNQKEAWLKLRVTRTLRSLWFLFVGICRLLQENENYLTAEEAYWIGLVDEIIGRPDLPSPRTFIEFADMAASSSK